MDLELNKTQTRALFELRGLPDQAHMLVMCARHTPTGSTLQGSDEELQSLLQGISEILAEELCPQRDHRPLTQICLSIDPGCADWLGQ